MTPTTDPAGQPTPQAAPVTLTRFSTVAVPATALQLIAGGPYTSWYVTIVNATTGILYVSNLNTVGNNATSFALPAGATMPTFKINSTTGIWVAAATAGSISVMLTPLG
jgi:hypothetical protein